MKIFMETLGCPKNFNDSERAAAILAKSGYEKTDSVQDADVIMVNTCGFINDAKRESIARIFDMVEVKEDKVLIVSGCLSKRYGDELFEEISEVDIFIGVNDYENLPKLINDFKKGNRQKQISQTSCDFGKPGERLTQDNPYSVTIKIAEGCDNRCAYCIIPYIRGPYRSREMADIIEEASMLAAAGAKELIIIAQDVTFYGKDLYGRLALPELLTDLCKIDGIEWIRLMYCYEDKITDELIQVMAKEPKICNYIDIPLQHASDKILSAMKRKGNRKSIMSTIEKMRKNIPDIHIRTTLITGFPGETKKEFDELYEFVETFKFERLGVFTYSKEDGTPAALMKPQVRSDVKQRRRESIMRLQNRISLEINSVKIGKTMKVLVEEIDESGSYIGRTQYDAPEIDNSVIFTSEKSLFPGDMVDVIIQDAFDYDLTGKEITEEA
ncbi:MAG: 30S ribosomal protein S12 methylthiotransferase RimO [Eubacteriales bacterium]|nr:30S ribosomal protein S12 methylthiotransferase RimO [Eubacteriales bacterium]MDD4390160.1 30S ribosomal protein S12 methylthiotransferase RimO [Eubacteriales bacterium]